MCVCVCDSWPPRECVSVNVWGPWPWGDGGEEKQIKKEKHTGGHWRWQRTKQITEGERRKQNEERREVVDRRQQYFPIKPTSRLLTKQVCLGESLNVTIITFTHTHFRLTEYVIKVYFRSPGKIKSSNKKIYRKSCLIRTISCTRADLETRRDSEKGNCACIINLNHCLGLQQQFHPL